MYVQLPGNVEGRSQGHTEPPTFSKINYAQCIVKCELSCNCYYICNYLLGNFEGRSQGHTY